MKATSAGWVPPDGAVLVVRGPGIHCSTCGHRGRAATPVKAMALAAAHRCPAGTAGAVPVCPVCRSTTGVCTTARVVEGYGEHVVVEMVELATWHDVRTRIAQAANGAT